MIDFLIIGGGIAGISAAARLSFHQDAGVLGPRGFLLIGRAGEDAAFDADRDYMQLEDCGTEHAHSLFPILNRDVITRAAHDPEAWDIDTDLLLQTFARIAKNNGAQIITNAPVGAIARTSTGWAVMSKETYDARVIVNAAGAWVDQIAILASIPPLGFTPLRRSMGRIPAPGGHDVSAWPMIFGPGETWYAKPDAGALLVSPADEDPVAPHDAYADDMVLAEGFARYEEHVTEPVTRLLSSWAGLRTFAPDRQLVIGRSPHDPDFIWCAGQGGYGMQSSPGASQFLADMIAGTPPAIDAANATALSPARFG